MKQRRAKLFALFAMFLALSLTDSAARTNELVILAKPIDVRSLSGHVQTQTSLEVVDDAHVEIFDLQTGGLLASCNTDKNGNFHFKDFGKKAYRVKVRMLGFNSLQATLRIRKNAPEFAIITLSIAT